MDRSDCSELEYAIYERNDCGYVRSRRDCHINRSGGVWSIWKWYVLWSKNNNGNDLYFECATGDLSGRCGTIPDDNSNNKYKKPLELFNECENVYNFIYYTFTFMFIVVVYILHSDHFVFYCVCV